MEIESGRPRAPEQSSDRVPAVAMTQSSPQCPHCYRQHTGEYQKLIGSCYRCGEQGLIHRDCPYRRDLGTTIVESTERPGQELVSARFYQEAAKITHGTTGKVFIFDSEIYVLIISESIPSMIASNVVSRLLLKLGLLIERINIWVSLGNCWFSK